MRLEIFLCSFIFAEIKQVCGSINLSNGRLNTDMSEADGRRNPGLVIDGDYSQVTGSCIETKSKAEQAWWQVTLAEKSFITSVELYSRNDHSQFQAMKRLAGFSIYVSNSSRVPSGERCYHHEGQDYPELHQFVTCYAIGKYVTVYVQRPPEPPSGQICYSSFAELELCEVEVSGCPVGFYGVGCIMACPDGCLSNQCDPDYGTCLFGCSGNRFGLMCDQECRDGDLTCSNICLGHCMNYNCDTTGVCLSGCEAGWTGETCEIECGSDFYGENCQQRCYCLHGECDNKNGTCPEEECIEGWQPPTCSKVALLTVQPDDMVSSTTFNAVVAFSMIANVVLLAILTAVCWKFKVVSTLSETKTLGSLRKSSILGSPGETKETVQYTDLKDSGQKRKTNDYTEHTIKISGGVYLEATAPKRDSKRTSDISSVYNNDEVEDIYYSIT